MLDLLLILAMAVAGYLIVANVMSSASPRPRAWHQVLGVAPSADDAAIEAAYAILRAHYRTVAATGSAHAARRAGAALAEVEAAYAAARQR